MDRAEAEEMLATTKRFPELVTMLCPPPFRMRADLVVEKLLAENFIGQTACCRRLQSFTGSLFEPGSAGALAAEDRDQRTQRADARNLRGSVAALARRHRWLVLRAGKFCIRTEERLQRHHS